MSTVPLVTHQPHADPSYFCKHSCNPFPPGLCTCCCLCRPLSSPGSWPDSQLISFKYVLMLTFSKTCFDCAIYFANLLPDLLALLYFFFSLSLWPFYRIMSSYLLIVHYLYISHLNIIWFMKARILICCIFFKCCILCAWYIVGTYKVVVEGINKHWHPRTESQI